MAVIETAVCCLFYDRYDPCIIPLIAHGRNLQFSTLKLFNINSKLYVLFRVLRFSLLLHQENDFIFPDLLVNRVFVFYVTYGMDIVNPGHMNSKEHETLVSVKINQIKYTRLSSGKIVAFYILRYAKIVIYLNGFLRNDFGV